MNKYTDSKNIGIRSVVGRSYIFASIIIISTSIIGAGYFNYINVKKYQVDDSGRKHTILSNMIIPALVISDTTEVRRLLSLSSSQNELFSVIDANKIILLHDYSALGVIKKIIDFSDLLDSCKKNRDSYQVIDGNYYWINCSMLSSSDLSFPKKVIGVLVSVSSVTWYSVSPMLIYFIGTDVISLLLTIIFLRHMLNKRIVRPLMQLSEHIANKTASPINAELSTLPYFTAPCEVVAIKNAFDKVMMELQFEYQKRAELSKREHLLNIAASLAHDIRSPLAVMEITLATLRNKYPESHHGLLIDSIQSVRNISNNLLERYRHSDKTEKISLSVLVEQVISQKREEWKDNPCNISFSIAQSNSFPLICASSNDIQRILSNLLNNAYEAQVRNKNIQVSLYENNHFLKLVIKDNGCGIPPDKVDDVLNGLSLKHAGAGLGLSSAKKYLESINGKLLISSIYGEYTELILLFPKQS